MPNPCIAPPPLRSESLPPLHVQDLDGAHWITPFDPAHTPDQAVDFPAEAIDFRKAAGLPAPFSSGLGWTPDGILQGGLHGGPPLFHISCLYELQPVGPGDGGFSCLAGSHLAGARIGPRGEDNVKRGHMPWGKQPWAPEVAKQVTRVEGQPWRQPCDNGPEPTWATCCAFSARGKYSK